MGPFKIKRLDGAKVFIGYPNSNQIVLPRCTMMIFVVYLIRSVQFYYSKTVSFETRFQGEKEDVVIAAKNIAQERN